jgi:hypothetical protein
MAPVSRGGANSAMRVVRSCARTRDAVLFLDQRPLPGRIRQSRSRSISPVGSLQPVRSSMQLCSLASLPGCAAAGGLLIGCIPAFVHLC